MQSPPKLHTLNNVSIQNNAAHALVIQPRWPWLAPLFTVSFMLLLGGVLLFGQNTFLIGLFPLGIALTILYRSPLASELTFDFVQQQMVFTAFYLLRWPQRTTFTQPFKDLVEVRQRQFKTHVVYIYTTSGHHWVLECV